MKNGNGRPLIFTGNANPGLAKKVCELLANKLGYAGLTLGKAMVGKFSDGEIRVEIQENVRGEDVYILQPTCPPDVNSFYMELKILADALNRSSAGSVTLIIPYYGYARQERKDKPRVPITAKLVADELALLKPARLVAFDLHASQIQGFFPSTLPVDHLFARPAILQTIKETYPDNSDLVIVSPDAGGLERAHAYAVRLSAEIAFIDKRRAAPNKIGSMRIIGDVSGKTCIILDDIVDTAGTLTQATELLLKEWATKVCACAVHPVLSGPAIKRISESPLTGVYVTDTIPLQSEATLCPKIKVVSVAGILANAVQILHEGGSLSSLFE